MYLGDKRFECIALSKDELPLQVHELVYLQSYDKGQVNPSPDLSPYYTEVLPEMIQAYGQNSGLGLSGCRSLF